MEYEKFLLSVQKENDMWNADIIPLQLKTVRCLQWNLTWYEDLIDFDRCDRFTYE